jgi:hypothetical protein
MLLLVCIVLKVSLDFYPRVSHMTETCRGTLDYEVLQTYLLARPFRREHFPSYAPRGCMLSANLTSRDLQNHDPHTGLLIHYRVTRAYSEGRV